MKLERLGGAVSALYRFAVAGLGTHAPFDFLSATDTPPSLCFLGEVGVSVSVVFVAVLSLTLLATGEVVAIGTTIEISQWLSFAATDTHTSRLHS